MKKIVIVLGIILLIFLVYHGIKTYTFSKGVTDNPPFEPPFTPSDIPKSVLLKFQELSQTYNKSLGALLEECTQKGIDQNKLTGSRYGVVYVVTGSGGYTGISYYYDKGGQELGYSEFTDAIDMNNPPPQPPIDREEYQCTMIKQSKNTFVEE